ncbi:MAG: tripartite tricarboxylate transporter permease [Firmicutes bacterium]|nr:tripartite tricarboxylate transporter permease [Bacillota bacterium]
MDALLQGIGQVLNFQTLFLMFVGTIAGLTAGALPGLTATMAVALLVPFTFTMTSVTGLATMGAVYMAAIYGGCFSAILINTPGTPSSIGTCFDGYPMAKSGRGQEAVVGATVASVFGGLFGLVVLAFLAPPLARVALKFGPPEYFWVSVFGLSIIASLASKSLIKGLIGGVVGLLISTIGIAPIGGDVRFTFGQPMMQGGIDLVGALIGLFCISEVLSLIVQGTQSYEGVNVVHVSGVIMKTFRKVLSMPVNLIRSSVIGTVIGIIPGAGGSIANLVSYNEAVRGSKHPEKFGTGILDGVVATEAANNATVGGGLVPLLTLGVPGTPVDDSVNGALLIHGLRPGPELFTIHADVTYGFIFSLFLSTLMMLVVGLAIGTALHRLVSRLPLRLLVPSIVFLTIIGSYAIRNNTMDVFLMLACGFIGYILKEIEIHPAPIVLGLILGPLAEEGFAQSMLMAKAFPSPSHVFFGRPICIILIVMTVVSLTWPFVSAFLAKHRKGGTVNA